MNIKQLRDVADNLFTKKQPLLSLWQELSEHFYVERADFTTKRSIGTDFAANLMSSYPLQCRRTLGNQFATMLRPTARPWFHVKRKYDKRDDFAITAQLQQFEEIQRRAMYDPSSGFLRATKEGDHDFAAFGQCAISVELNRLKNGLLYRSWHLRDMAWQEDEEGSIGFIARKAKMTAQSMIKTFKNVHSKVTEAAAKEPFTEFNLYHIVCDAEMYDKQSRGFPRMSIWYDIDHESMLIETPIRSRHYVIPRWQTVSGSQYSYSPATVCALPDARLLQAMTLTLLEAGEKATSPPMIATQDAVRSDVSLAAGGITWISEEYDERMGSALRPLEQDFRGFNYGVAMNQDTRAMLHNAFYLDALKMPERGPEMTAYEVGQRVQEYIRNALPIFEPMEMEYNARLCEETFDLLLNNGGFGPPAAWPKGLSGAEVDFAFESPLHDAIEEQKGRKFQQAQQLIGSAIALDPACAFVPKAEVALRDALLGIGVPAEWINDSDYVAKAKAAQAQQAAQQSRLAAMEQASNAAKNLGQAGVLQPQQAPA